MRKILLPLLFILLFIGCKKQVTKDVSPDEKNIAASAKPIGKINVCHYDAATNTYTVLNLSLNALPQHQAHGDIRLDDQDGDGYVPTNSCGFGKMGDLNDLGATIYPGSPEICGNNIDDNSNGMVDECCLTTVNICGVNWMKKNFDCTTYRNGDAIPQVTDAAQWASLTTGAWCYYNNDPAMGAIYGKLYNYYAITDPRGIAPAGWHVPNRTERDNLTECAGGVLGAGATGFYAGGNLKEAGTVHWLSPNLEGRDSTGFTALPGGRRTPSGLFYGINSTGTFWTTTNYVDETILVLDLFNSSGYTFEFNAIEKSFGASLRLVKD
jgi:uncharacterized protein (TIGR02145 family)